MSSTTRVSTTSTGQQANGPSALGTVGSYTGNSQALTGVFSPDGGEIVFETAAANIAGGTSATVILKNLVTGQDTVESGGAGAATAATLSPNGNAIVYDEAPAAGGTSQVEEVNVATGQTSVVSSSGTGAAGNGASALVGVSTDGNKVLFESAATNLVSSPVKPTTAAPGVFVKNTATGQITQIGGGSGTSDILNVNANMTEALYADIPTASGAASQIYAQNIATGATSIVSSDAAGNPGNQGATQGAVTADGTRAVFGSDSTNLLASAPAGGLFTKDLSTQAVGLIAANQVTSSGANSRSGLENSAYALSQDSTKLVYVADTYAYNTASDGTQSNSDTTQLKVANLGTGATTSVSPVFTSTSSFSPPNATVEQQSQNGSNVGLALFSPDGTKIAYTVQTATNETSSFNTATGQASNGGSFSSQVLVYDVATGQTTAVSGATPSPSTSYVSVAFSPDSRDLVYTAYSNAGTQTVVTNLATGAQTIVPASTAGAVAFSPDSASIAFASTASTLVPGDTNAASDVFIQPLCFATGTAIRTARGDVAVEDLLVGDRAVTASGATRPIVWIGHRHLDCAALPVPSEGWPVRVRAGAFGVGRHGTARPGRDLRLSPGHPVLVDDGADGVLVPIMCLINGTSVARAPVDRLTYWHVELDAHDVLLAEGLPAESYLDLGGRAWFAARDEGLDGGLGEGLGEGLDDRLTNPDLLAPAAGGRCRAVAVDGPPVARERRRLDALFAAGLAAHCDWTGARGATWTGGWPGADEGSPAS